MKLRGYTEGDAEGTRRVFKCAATITAALDYNPAQVQAWASAADDPAAWAEARLLANTCVALVDGEIAGFIDVDDAGYIDVLFVEPASARSGIATTLLAWTQQQAKEAGAQRLSTHASITARPFFEARGFTVTKKRHPIVRGVQFTNYLMETRLRTEHEPAAVVSLAEYQSRRQVHPANED